MGCLAVVLAAMGGCSDSRQEADSAVKAQRAGALTEGGPVLVKDIRPQSPYPRSAGSEPQDYLVAGSNFFFTATDMLHGRELWVSNAQGTRLLRDFYVGNQDGYPQLHAAVGDTLLFSSYDGASTVLWESDGTEAGTRPVVGAPPRIKHTKLVGTTLFISAGDYSDTELWKRDALGNFERVKDIHPYGSSPRSTMVELDGKLYFTADDGMSGVELWTSDGTETGTWQVKDLTPGPEASRISELVAGGGKLYFLLGDCSYSVCELWTSDGTDEGTQRVKSIPAGSYPTHLTNLNGTLFYNASDAVSGREVWRSDGTEEGTRLLKDIVPGAGGSEPFDLRGAGGTLYFSAMTPEHGREVWKSDGTEPGTVRITDVVAGPRDSVLGNLAVAGSRVYFFAPQEWGGGYDLWTSDGSESGTQLLARYQAFAWNFQVPTVFASSGDTLYFAADDGATGVEPWVTDGTPMNTRRLADVNSAGESSQPQSMMSVGGTLLFFAYGENGTSELWKSDGTEEGTVLMKDGFSANGSVYPRVVGGVVYFQANVSGTGSELWVSDGTLEGTRLVKDLEPSWNSSSPHPVADVGGKLIFTARTSAYGSEPWVSDGTPEGTRLLKDIHPDPRAWSTPWDFVKVGETVYFSAEDTVSGRELWKTDGTPAGTVMVKDLRPGTLGGNPSQLVNLNGSLVFVANTNETSSKRALWKMDAAGNVQRITVSASGSVPYELDKLTVVNGTLFFFGDPTSYYPSLWKYDGQSTSATLVSQYKFNDYIFYVASSGKHLFFRAYDSRHGWELWRSDGTADGTRLVKDVLPGRASAVEAMPLYGLPERGLVLFRASNGAQGLELWMSDGTEEGTRPLGDIAPGARSSDPREVALSGDNVFFSADDGTHGAELWRYALAPVVPPDTTPPTLTCPASVTVEAVSSYGASFFWPDATAVDDVTASPTVTYSHISGKTFPLGKTTVTATAKDAAGNEGTCSFDVTVRDSTAPVLTCSKDVAVEATSADGAVASYAVATASDAVTSSPTVTYSQASGTMFPLGKTTVTATAKDAAGNQGTCSFSVTVSDATAPVLTCPASLELEATGAQGAMASFEATVRDSVSATPSVTYSHAPGSTFALGTTQVTVTAKDTAGNTNACSFGITVKDTTKPTLSCPATVTAEALSASGVAVTYGEASASDAVSAVAVTYSHASGSEFILGTTEVTVTAKDAAGNSATCSFPVTVQDTTAPAMTCPADVEAEASGPSGAEVSFAAATANDTVSGSLGVTYSHAPGSTFVLGTTQVTVTAKDVAGNSATCSFGVTVKDTTKPTLSCPAAVTAEALSASGAAVTYGEASASDAVSAVAVTYSHTSGSEFILGTTEVTVTAKDAAGNTHACSFPVLVRDTTVPAVTCPADLGVEAVDGSGAVVSFAEATVSDAVTTTPSVTYSHAPGSTFVLGTTQVTATVKDAAGNTNACSFGVTVKDTTKPTLSCPAAVTAEATSFGGATVMYAAATSTDSVTGSPEVTYSQSSGGTFVLGTTEVAVTAKDAAGNSATCSFPVTVRDTTAPAMTCPADVEVETKGNQSRTVEYALATVSDAVTASPVMTYSQASGSTFPVGTTPVEASATDAAGNKSSCSFRVTVKSPGKPSQEPQVGLLGCGATGNAPAGLWGVLMMLVWVAVRRPSAQRD